jgi:hypothetical protein
MQLIRGRVRAIVSAIVIGVVLAISCSTTSRRHRPPTTYAVCSSQLTSLIYTVDAQETAPTTVECLVVSNDRIIDRGSQAHIRRVWGDKDTIIPPSSVNPLVPKGGVKIYHLRDGEAMYPGFADAHAHILGVC